MRIVPPFTVNNSNLTASNVPEVAPSDYSAGTTYDTGDRAGDPQGDTAGTIKVYESKVDSNTGNALTDTDYWLYLGDTYEEYDVGTSYAADRYVISTSTNHVYQSLTGSNLGNSLSNTAAWLDLGPTNRYLMFDLSNSSQTVNGDEIDLTIDVTGRINSVAFLNIVASELQVIVTDATDGVVYDETISLIASDDVSNWWEYFFLPVRRYGDWTFLDLPTYSNPTVRLIIRDPGATVKVGSAVLGLSRNIGNTVYPSDLSIQDYSRKEVDDFGYYTIVVRDFAKKANLKVSSPENQVDVITEILADLRATPCLFVGVEAYRASWVYGFYREWKWQLAGPNESYLYLDIEGLT